MAQPLEHGLRTGRDVVRTGTWAGAPRRDRPAVAADGRETGRRPRNERLITSRLPGQLARRHYHGTRRLDSARLSSGLGNSPDCRAVRACLTSAVRGPEGGGWALRP